MTVAQPPGSVAAQSELDPRIYDAPCMHVDYRKLLLAGAYSPKLMERSYRAASAHKTHKAASWSRGGR
jgi:hypothetical protein